jgi:hypothetical protein
MRSLRPSDECNAAQAAVETGASTNGRSDSTFARLFSLSYSEVPEFHPAVVEQQSLPMGHMLRDSFSYPFGLIRKHPVQETFRWNLFREFKVRCHLNLNWNFRNLIQDSCDQRMI